MENYFDQDIIYLICQYLDLPEILSFKSTNHFYYDLLSNNLFWLTMIHSQLVPLIFSSSSSSSSPSSLSSPSSSYIPNFISEKWALKFQSFLKVSNYYEVYSFLYLFHFPFFGSYEKIIPLSKDISSGCFYDLSSENYRGGLMKISYNLNLNIFSLECNEEQWFYEIQYRSNHIIACDSHSNHIYTIRSNSLKYLLLFYDPRTDQCLYQYQLLSLHHPHHPHPHHPHSHSHQIPRSYFLLNNSSSLVTQMNSLLLLLPPMNMLYNGVYGPHGTEIIYLTFEKLSEMHPPLRQRLPSRDQWDTCEYVVTGRKITGDANVPAQQLSFILNPRLAIMNLQRIARGEHFLPISFSCPSPHSLSLLPIVLSPAITFLSTEDLNFVSIIDRLPAIASCYKGPLSVHLFLSLPSPHPSTAFGQINRHPGVWYPEWLRAYLLVYHPLDHPSRQTEESQTVTPSRLPAGVAYSIIFIHNTNPDLGSDDEGEEDGEGPQILLDGMTRSHMIDFSVSCWS
jgi:hypothetical protein